MLGPKKPVLAAIAAVTGMDSSGLKPFTPAVKEKLASYQELVSPMPLLLDTVAGSISCVPAHLYDDEIADDADEMNDDDDSLPDTYATYSNKPSPGKNMPGNTKLVNHRDSFVYQNRGASFTRTSPPQSPVFPSVYSQQLTNNPFLGNSRNCQEWSKQTIVNKDPVLTANGQYYLTSVASNTFEVGASIDLWEQANNGAQFRRSPGVSLGSISASGYINQLEEEKISSV